MSDGNFNRSMLPSNGYQSGVRAGQAQMKRLAVEAFGRWFVENHPETTAEELKAAQKQYKQMLP